MDSDDDGFGLEDGEGDDDDDDGVATFVRSSGDVARLNGAQQVRPLWPTVADRRCPSDIARVRTRVYPPSAACRRG